MLTETAARWLLVLHTALGVGAIGAATHLVLWLRRYRRGELGLHRAVRRFAWLALVLQLGGFALGQAMYPTYRVEVRARYLEDVGAVERDPRSGPDAPAEAERASRWFEVKEHAVALGILALLALVLILAAWDPRRDGLALLPAAQAFATFVAATLWLAAIVGVGVASWRAV